MKGKILADKRYYWFKMEQSFFEQKEIKYLRRLPGGDTYTIIYLKLILKSLENDGKIYYENIGDDYSQEWALEIEEDEKAVSFLVAFLINKGLMIDCGFDEFEITKTKSLVGSETVSAERKRRQREREREFLQFNNVTDSQKSVTLSQVSHIEIDIDIEKEKEKVREKEREYNVEENFIFPDYLSEKAIESIKKGNPKNFNFRIPIAYLNQVTDSNFKFVDVNLNLVKARLKDGFELDDFKKVIDVKFAEWANTDMEKYIRPKTLFAPKNFDSYLNQKSAVNNYGNRIVKEAPKWASNGKQPEEEELTPEEAEAFFNGY